MTESADTAGQPPRTGALPEVPGWRLSPRYWPVRAGFGLLALAARLPYPYVVRLGTLFGRAACRMARKRRSVVRTNLRLCFPELSEPELESMTVANFESTGIGLLEVGICWYAPERITRLGEVDGIEYLDAALAQGRGAILLCVHLTHFEIGGSIVGQLRRTAAMYAPNDSPVFEQECRRGRLNHACELIPRDNARAAVRCLRNNVPLWYTADEDMAGGRQVFVPFFGVPTSTLVAVARLAHVAGSPILPLTQVRREDASGFVTTIHPPVRGLTGTDDARDAAIVTKFFEDYLRRRPQDYLWVRRRFRRRPEGEESVYEQRSRRTTVSANRYRALIRSGEVLEWVNGKPRTIRTPEGDIVKFFHRGERPSRDWILSPARGFRETLEQRRRQGARVPAPVVDAYCPAYRCAVLRFHPADEDEARSLMDQAPAPPQTGA